MNHCGFELTDSWSWICHHGAPSAAGRDMPSYELEDGTLQVYDFMVVALYNPTVVMMFSRFWGVAAAISHDDMVPLHHSERAWWRWRPVVYSMMGNLDLELAYWQALGSQQELGWRNGMFEAMGVRHFGDEFSFPDADERATALLIENLSPQQRLEIAQFGWFRCRGGTTGNLYKIEPGNGFAILDPRTCKEVVSYCLHPESWIPHDDVALSTKFALEDEELEVECLENARMSLRNKRRKVTMGDMVAQNLERKLVPQYRELVIARGK